MAELTEHAYYLIGSDELADWLDAQDDTWCSSTATLT